MGVTSSSGPTITAGPNYSTQASTGNAPEAGSILYGPSATYQGDCILDPRFPVLKDANAQGRHYGHLDSPFIYQLDFVPSASAATPVNVAAAQNATSGTAFALATASAGITPAVPFYPLAQINYGGALYPGYGSTPVLSGVTLDMGFATLSVTSGSTAATATVANAQYFWQGQSVVIGTAGAAAGAGCLITKIAAVNYTTGAITLASPALFTNTAAPVGQGNITSVLSTGTSTAWTPRVPAGVMGPWNPLDFMSRNVGIGGSAGATGGAFLVRGYDIYGAAMSETITAAAGVGPTYGRKAFKHIASVTPQFTDAHAYSVGTGDTVGFGLRTDKIEYVNTYVSGAYVGVATGFTPADLTSPATSTTGDVRGTLQVGTRGAGTGFSGGPFNGTIRVAIAASVPLFNLTAGTAANPAPMYGVTQA